jgi:hypothetical protein
LIANWPQSQRNYELLTGLGVRREHECGGWKVEKIGKGIANQFD